MERNKVRQAMDLKAMDLNFKEEDFISDHRRFQKCTCPECESKLNEGYCPICGAWVLFDSHECECEEE